MAEDVLMSQSVNVRVLTIAMSSDARVLPKSLEELEAQHIYEEAKRGLRQLARGRSKK